MAVRNSNSSSGERALLIAFFLLAALVAVRWVVSVWPHR